MSLPALDHSNFQLIPALPFEEEYSSTFADSLFLDNPYAAVTLSACYLVVVFILKWGMASRKAFKLQRTLAAWNALLALFSFIGLMRTAPQLGYNVWKYGVVGSFCHDGRALFGGRHACGLWIFLFVASKALELGDTLFVVLRKSSLKFIHWYHHVTVLVWSYHSFTHAASPCHWFTVANLWVHALMYFYYFLAAVGRKPWWGRYLTVFQILQMVLGLCITIYASYQYHVYDACAFSIESQVLSLAIYGSYLVLFIAFYIQTYNNKAGKKIE